MNILSFTHPRICFVFPHTEIGQLLHAMKEDCETVKLTNVYPSDVRNRQKYTESNKLKSTKFGYI